MIHWRGRLRTIAEACALAAQEQRFGNLRAALDIYNVIIDKLPNCVSKMLDFLGLDWDERCISPHTNPYPVETASDWQVRQPIYSDSVGRWRHYDKYLAPLKELFPPSRP